MRFSWVYIYKKTYFYYDADKETYRCKFCLYTIIYAPASFR
jgi:hypothetical protein